MSGTEGGEEGRGFGESVVGGEGEVRRFAEAVEEGQSAGVAPAEDAVGHQRKEDPEEVHDDSRARGPNRHTTTMAHHGHSSCVAGRGAEAEEEGEGESGTRSGREDLADLAGPVGRSSMEVGEESASRAAAAGKAEEGRWRTQEEADVKSDRSVRVARASDAAHMRSSQ